MFNDNQENLRLKVQTEEKLISNILEQIEILANWNVLNINDNPEQVRKNIETMILAFNSLPFGQYPLAPDEHL